MLAGASIASDDLDATKIGANHKKLKIDAQDGTRTHVLSKTIHVQYNWAIRLFPFPNFFDYINYWLWRKWLTVKPKAPEGLILAGLYY